MNPCVLKGRAHFTANKRRSQPNEKKKVLEMSESSMRAGSSILIAFSPNPQINISVPLYKNKNKMMEPFLHNWGALDPYFYKTS